MRFIAVLSSCNYCLNACGKPPRAASQRGGRDAQVSIDDCRGGGCRDRWSFRFQYRTSRDRRGEAAEFSPSRSPSWSPSICLSSGPRRRNWQAPGNASHQQAVPGNCPSGVGVVMPVSSNFGTRWLPSTSNYPITDMKKPRRSDRGRPFCINLRTDYSALRRRLISQ
jgi:hypothetical protein